MPETQKETVIIVHGTWAAPIADSIKWYQPSAEAAEAKQEFVARLDTALEKRGSPARCWAHCQDGTGIFCWSGHNAWVERSRASTELAEAINRLQSDGWRVHPVAHSHGGNVAAEALSSLETTRDNNSGLSGTVTTLGTPFIDTMSPIARRLDWRHRITAGLAWTSYVLVALVGFFFAAGVYFQEGEGSVYAYIMRHRITFAVSFALLATGLFSLLHGRPPAGWTKYWKRLATADRAPFILIMNSAVDEAWQLLHHLRTIESPLRSKSGPLRYILNSRREYLRKSREVERVHGAALFGYQSWPTRIAVILLSALLMASLFGIASALVTDTSDRPDNPRIADWYLDYRREHGMQPSANIEALKAEETRLLSQKDADPEALRKARAANSNLLNKKAIEEIEAFPADEKNRWQLYRQSRHKGHILEVVLGSGLLLLMWGGFVSIATFFLGRTFYSAVWAPFRWSARQVRALMGLPSYVASYIVRRNVWSLLQELTMGLDGYRLRLPAVDKIPGYMPANCFKYEDMPRAAEARALARRNEWISQHFGDVTDTFSKLVVTSADVSELLRIVEDDLSLVHAAYHTDDECIARIADWIAASDAERQPVKEVAQAASPTPLVAVASPA